MTDTFTGETYNALCGDAEGYLAGGAAEQARELLLKAISMIGTRPRARSLLADTCMSMELWPEAREQLEILITLEEGNTRNNFRLGQVLEELGEYQLAADNYTVVLNEDPRHHGAIVALKRIAVRTNESGVNLVDIFASSGTPPEGAKSPSDGKQDRDGVGIEGLHVFPDQPSEDVFAESEQAGETVTLDSILDNMGMKPSPDGWKAEDVSKLLDGMTAPDADHLQALFAAPSPAEEPGEAPVASPFGTATADLESIFSGSGTLPERIPEGARTAPSLEDIFGGTMKPPVREVVEPEIVEPEVIVPEIVEPEVIVPEIVEPEIVEPEVIVPEIVEPEVIVPEIVEPEVIVPEVVEPEIVEPEIVEPEVVVPEVVEPEVIVPEVEETPPDIFFPAGPDPSVFGSMDALEAIFSAAAASTVLAVPKEEPEVVAPEVIAPEVIAPEVIVPEVVEPEAVETESVGLEVVFGTGEEDSAASVPDAEAPVAVAVEAAPPEAPEPSPELPPSPVTPDFFIETWSPETGLVAVTLFSGTISVRTPLLAAFESSLYCEPGAEGVCEVRGEGTMMLNCGPVEPLVMDAADGMKVRMRLLALIPVDPAAFEETCVEGLSRVVSAEGMKLLFSTDAPVRRVTLEGGTTALLVRAASLAAASPGVEISEDSVLAGYLTATGQGRLFLME